MKMSLTSTIQFSVEIPVYPERVYRAWLDGYEHSRFTGKKAEIEPRPAGLFTSLDKSVSGRLLRLVPHTLIEQTWQVHDLPLGEDSRIILRLQPTCTGCELSLFHYDVPYSLNTMMLSWWETNYLRPLRLYFEELIGDYVADMGDG